MKGSRKKTVYDFDKENETFLKRWIPGGSIFNIKRNFNRTTPVAWFFLFALAFIILGSLSSVIRIFLWIGLFMIFIFIVYLIVFILTK